MCVSLWVQDNMYVSFTLSQQITVMLDNKIIENLKPKTNIEVLIENKRNKDRTKFDQGTIFFPGTVTQ